MMGKPLEQTPSTLSIEQYTVLHNYIIIKLLAINCSTHNTTRQQEQESVRFHFF